LKPVDVILRRVDEEWCDPLELRQDSRLGVAGLVEAVRRGNVAMANPLGSGLLENPALIPFLPVLAKACWAKNCCCRVRRPGGAASNANASMCWPTCSVWC
jgi:uncharacterized circularly permuted ATP-grasp superfamily protein